MDLTRPEFEDLVGAYALDACEPEEIEAIERYIAVDAAAAAEVARLREIAAGIGAAGASEPPIALRARLIHAAGDRVVALAADVALAKETDRFDSFLSTLDESDLGVVTENGLTVRELVQHIEVVDRAFVDAAPEPDAALIAADAVAEITARALPGLAAEPFDETVARFRQTRRALGALHDELPADRRVGGYTRDSTLVIRAFETWTHLEDAERALGRAVTEPEPAVMRTLADLAAASLPFALFLRGTTRPGVSIRLVLDGAGGGEWTLPCSPGEAPAPTVDVVLHASVVDWCRRFADRIAADDIAITVDGDADLARELVTAANALAGL